MLPPFVALWLEAADHTLTIQSRLWLSEWLSGSDAQAAIATLPPIEQAALIREAKTHHWVSGTMKFDSEMCRKTLRRLEYGDQTTPAVGVLTKLMAHLQGYLNHPSGIDDL